MKNTTTSDVGFSSRRKRMTSWPVGAVLAGLVTIGIVIPVLAILARSFKPARARDLFGTASSPWALLKSGDFYGTIGQTLLLAAATAALSTLVGGVLAWLLTQLRLRFTASIHALILLNLLLSPFVGTIAWMSIGANGAGLGNALIHALNFPEWMEINVASIGGIVSVMTLHYVPYSYLVIRSGLMNTDSNLTDAALVSGHSSLRTALSVTVPLLKGPVLSSLLFVGVLSVGMFSIPALLGVSTGLRPLAVQVYYSVYGFPTDEARAAMIGVLLIAVSVTLLYFYRRATSQSRRFQQVGSRGARHRRIVLSPAVSNLLSYALVFSSIILVVAPYIVLLVIAFNPYQIGSFNDIRWTLEPAKAAFGSDQFGSALLNTIIVSVLAPIICLAIGSLVVVYADNRRTLFHRYNSYSSIAPLGLPGIVFGAGVAWAAISTPLYGTLFLVVIAFAAYYLPHAVRIIGNGMEQISDHMEESARVCGSTPSRVLRHVQLPLLAPSLLSSATLIFVFCSRELNVAIMLYTPSTNVLPTLSWTQLADGQLPTAAVTGLVQTGVMIVGLVAIQVIARRAGGAKIDSVAI